MDHSAKRSKSPDRVGPMTDEERLQLAKKLDDELDGFIENCEKKPYKDGFSENNWEEELQMHPAFRTESIDGDQQLPPLVEAMQQLKYDPAENEPDELASNYKDDGNYNFKLKKYRWAIDNYTTAIKIDGVSDLLKIQLYTNRAAAHFYLGNYRSSLADCDKAVQIKGDHIKAIVRAAHCCFELCRYGDAISWCNRGLEIDLDNTLLLTTKSKSEHSKKIRERDNRRKLVEEKASTKKEESLISTIKARGIVVGSDNITLKELEPRLPLAFGSRVHLNEAGHLVWPVMFVYPEYQQTDFIRQFNELDTFFSHLIEVFGSDDCEHAPWDEEHKYKPENCLMYFEDKDEKLWEIDCNKSLGSVLVHPNFVVTGGTPSFFVLAAGTRFLDSFLGRYSNVGKV